VEEGRNVLTTDDIETVDVADLNKGNESRSDATEKCPVCHGVEGKHFPHCPKQPISDERNPAEGNDELPPPALEQNEVGDELPGRLDPHSKPLSQGEIQDHFDKADELFEGKKFEDGAVVEEEGLKKDMESFADKIGISPERREGISAAADEMMKPLTPEEQLSSVKLPPSAQMLVGNELLWLIARTCHEVNRAYCVGVMSDHSHQPWDQSPDWQRESCYEGVLKHYHNPSFTPEDSHRSWMAKKIDEGWVFGNLKDVNAKTHPCLVPYHTLHIHDRTKDAIFSAICKSMLGGVR
jgi:hypothetical protein